jgi:hypothetical protein
MLKAASGISVRGHGLGILKGAAGLEIGSDPCRAEGNAG